MYKYFKELNNPNEYKIYLSKPLWDIKSEYRLRGVPLPNDFISKYKNLLERFKTIDKLVEGYNETLAYKEKNINYDEWLYRNDYFDWKDNRDFEGLEEQKRKFEIYHNASSMKKLLEYYSICCNFFLILFPNQQGFIVSTKKMLEEAINELDVKLHVDLPKIKNRMIELTWPNGWFIAPNGYLYNPGFEKGHKEGSLLYSFNHIRELLENNQKIPNINYDEKIAEILKEGFVTEMWFQNYANLIDSLPSCLLTREQLYTLNCYINIMENKKEPEHFKKIILPRKDKFVEIKSPKEEPMIKVYNDCLQRSYQPNIVNLVVGYLNAKNCLYKAFRRVNNSSRKSEILKKVYNLSWRDYNDILIKFCGFHKIETCEKKITTASLYGADLFKEYLEKGWYLYIIPPLVYDAYLDDINELDFHSYFLDAYFDKILNENSNNKRILIKSINC